MTGGRRGFVLPSVLIAMAILTAASVHLVAATRDRVVMSANREGIVAATWAVEACLERLRRDLRPESWSVVWDSVPVGTRTWCVAVSSDPGERFHLGRVSPELLERIVPDEAALASLREWGPLEDLEELSEIPGFTPELVKHVASRATLEGDGLVNLNAAPVEVLALLPGMSPMAAQLTVQARERQGEFMTLNALLAALPPSVAEDLGGSYQELVQMVRFIPDEVVISVAGYSPQFRTGLRARAFGRFVDGRLRIHRRELP